MNCVYLFTTIFLTVVSYINFAKSNSLHRVLRDISENDISNQNECGQRFVSISQPLIVFGQNAKYNEFPWHVGIYKKEKEDPYPIYICGGSIISKNTILTVAHCFMDEDGSLFDIPEYYIAAGKYYNNYFSQEDKLAQKRSVLKIEIHPLYKGVLANFGWDIAIVKVNESFVLSDIVQPVCVDFNSDTKDESMKSAEYGEVAGWGFTEKNLNESNFVPSNELKVLSVPYIEYNKCVQEFPRSSLKYLTPDKFCAGFRNGSSVCIGDSGSGLVFEKTENNETRYYIRGMVSTGVQKDTFCDNFQYTTYTRISDYITFIHNYVQSSCVTPNGELAKCVAIKNCKVFLDALESNTTTDDFYRFVTDSQCGYIDGNPFVCCGSTSQFLESSNKTVRKLALTSKFAEHKNFKLLPSHDVCGQHKFHFNKLGSVFTGLGEFPWIANILYQLDDQQGGYLSNGVLINERYILSVTHAFIEHIYKHNVTAHITLGEFNKKTDPDCVTEDGETICADKVVRTTTTEIIPHPMYEPKNATNDISLLRLKKNLQLSTYLRPVCLPLFEEKSKIGDRSLLTAWGKWGTPYESIMLKIYLPIADPNLCEVHYNKYHNQFAGTEYQMCVGGEKGFASCAGDSGAPLMQYISNTSINYYVEGLVVMGPPICGTKGIPSVSTRVSKHIQWILDTIKS